MATIRESNARAVNTLGGELHWRTNFRHRWLRSLANRFDVWRLPMCGKCEQIARWHHEGTAFCISCGHTTPNPITVQQYYEQGFHVDRTVNPDAPVFIDREKVGTEAVTGGSVATIYGGEADLADPNQKILYVVRR